jgi:hypothetical protein
LNSFLTDSNYFIPKHHQVRFIQRYICGQYYPLKASQEFHQISFFHLDHRYNGKEFPNIGQTDSKNSSLKALNPGKDINDNKSQDGICENDDTTSNSIPSFKNSTKQALNSTPFRHIPRI